MNHLLKYCIVSVFFLLCFQSQSNAQNPPEIRPQMLQRVQAIKWEFITNRMNLSADKLDKLHPIYNRYQAEIAQIIATRKRPLPIDQMTDEEAAALLQQKQNNAQKMLTIWDKYQPQFLTVLSPTEVLRLQRAEQEFAAKLIEYRQRRKATRRRFLQEE